MFLCFNISSNLIYGFPVHSSLVWKCRKFSTRPTLQLLRRYAVYISVLHSIFILKYTVYQELLLTVMTRVTDKLGYRTTYNQCECLRVGAQNISGDSKHLVLCKARIGIFIVVLVLILGRKTFLHGLRTHTLRYTRFHMFVNLIVWVGTSVCVVGEYCSLPDFCPLSGQCYGN